MSDPSPLPTVWRFFVPGQPITQGNHRAFVVAGKARITEKKPVGLALWRHSISDEARRARGDSPPLVGPVRVDLTFWIPKPASAPKRRQTWPIKSRSGDVDKLSRAAFDAMTGVLFADDAQIVRLYVEKQWDAEGAFGPGVTVTVAEVRT